MANDKVFVLQVPRNDRLGNLEHIHFKAFFNGLFEEVYLKYLVIVPLIKSISLKIQETLSIDTNILYCPRLCV